MNLEVQEPSSQSHFLSLGSIGGQFSWGRVLMQGEFNAPTAHYGLACATLQDCDWGRNSGQQRQQTWEQVTLLPPGLGWRQPKTQTTPGSSLTPCVLCLAHFHFTEEKYSQNLPLFLVTAFNCKKSLLQHLQKYALCSDFQIQGISRGLRTWLLSRGQAHWSTCAHLQITDVLRPRNTATKSGSSQIWTHKYPYRDPSSALITVRLFSLFI